ncbi:MAG: PQQ-binding-like beta-propeller repeat protein [Candidatus Bathyarchaeota archaeon]|nr:PQQ-binding-like beta-propeller repeat protein [Candidatus Bathyarchaeota archaeon]
MAVAIVAVPASAHTPAWTNPSWCFVSLSNNPIGVNQQEIIVFWLQDPPPTASGAYGDRWTFYVDITKPDGSLETLGPFTSDPVGNGYALYTPDQVGDYTIVARFPGQTITGLPLPPYSDVPLSKPDYVNDTYAASTSDPVILKVQTDPIVGWTEPSVPTGYWERPINSANRGWYVLTGNWLAGAAQIIYSNTNFAYGPGPESPHILWTKQYWAGGIMDSRYGDIGYQGSHYEGLSLTPPIILNGKLYYNVQSLPKEGWYCVDLNTGETEYFYNTTGPVSGVSQSSSGSIPGESLAFGQILNYDSPNQHGGMAYLWSTSDPNTPNTWRMYDAFTGNYMCSVNNVPSFASGGRFGGSSAGQVYGKDGSILRYNLQNYGSATNPRYYLQCWNTTQAIWWKESWTSNYYWMWRPGLNETYDGNNGYSLNVSIPAVQGSILVVREDQFVIGGTSGQNDDRGLILGNMWALSLKSGEEGKLLWNYTFTPPNAAGISGQDVNTYRAMKYESISPEDDVFIYRQDLTRQYWGFNLTTGEQIWESEPESQMQYYGLSTADCCGIYDGKFFSYGYGGQVTAYNITTGDVVWQYTAEQVGFESPYGNYPVGIAAIADGKLYLTTSEHSPTQPLFRGSYLRCVNATDGTEIWKVLHWSAAMAAGSGVAIGDGRLVSLNIYDNKIYCYGKGPSATTVTVSNKVIEIGHNVMIEGTVTDQSPGAEGTPAISDADQQAWMEYLYGQQVFPADAQGVSVHLTAIDPNGNFQDIGTVTSDINGVFKKMWQPPVPGEYVVTATFDGSAAYGGSHAESTFGVEETQAVQPSVAPQSTNLQPATTSSATPQSTLTETTPLPSPADVPHASGVPTTTYIVISATVIAIAVIVVVAIALRRRN